MLEPQRYESLSFPKSQSKVCGKSFSKDLKQNRHLRFNNDWLTHSATQFFLSIVNIEIVLLFMTFVILFITIIRTMVMLIIMITTLFLVAVVSIIVKWMMIMKTTPTFLPEQLQCEQRGCCWSPLDERNVPWCFFSTNHGYTVESVEKPNLYGKSLFPLSLPLYPNSCAH